MDSNSKLLAAICHLSVFVGLGAIIPLIIFLIKKDDEFVLAHAKQALVSQVAFLIGYFVSGLLIFLLIGFLLIPILAIMQIVFTIKATVKTMNGEYYDYPITGELAEKF